MGVAINQDTEYAKMMAQHEANHSPFGPPGRPYVYYPLPTMMYKAGRVNDGPVGIIDSETAHSEPERAGLERRGFVAGGQAAAIEAFYKEQQEMSVLAANREHADKNMGEKAKAEADAFVGGSSEHVAEVPAVPIKPRSK